MGEAAEQVLFTVREGRAGDHALVFSSWLGSDRFSRAGQACSRVYQQEHERVVRGILARAGVLLRVAALPDDDDGILGWAVIAPAERTVFYVYVKRGVREKRIASTLLGDMLGGACHYTHQPVVQGRKVKRGDREVFEPLCPPRNWVFDPYRNYVR
jgi:hypothetical protein